MAIPVKRDYDFEQNQILNVVVDNKSGNPATNNLVPGQIYFNTQNHLMYYFDGTNLIDVRNYSGGTGIDINNGEVAIDSTVVQYEGLSIEENSTDYLTYDSTTGEFGANVDTEVTQGSTNLITSGGVYTAITNALIGGVIYKGVWNASTSSSVTITQSAGTSLSDLAVDKATFEAYVGTTANVSLTFLYDNGNWYDENTELVNIADYGISYVGTPENNDQLAVVYEKATTQSNYSEIPLPVKAGYMYYVIGSTTIENIEWNEGDYLLIIHDVAVGETITNNDVQKIDNTEASDIVRLNAIQTLTNKTINSDNNTITNLETDNFKAGVVRTSIRPVASASDTTLATEKAIITAITARKVVVTNTSTLIPVSGVVTWTFTNPLNDIDLLVFVYDISTNTKVEVELAVTSSNITVTMNSSANIATGSYKAVIYG